MLLLLFLVLVLVLVYFRQKQRFSSSLNHKAVIVGTARDIDSYVNGSINKLKDISKLFSYCPIIIYENDSNDNTLRLLKSFEPDITVISEKGVQGNRTQRLAYARNKLHDYVVNLNIPFDYYIICDLDEKISKLTPESIASCFKHTGWSMMGANQVGDYYDLWALRTFDDWCDHDCFDNNTTKISCSFKNIPKNNILIQVKSCFGGTGVYKFKDTIGCTYRSYAQEHNPEICEHVPFHQDMIEKHQAKIFINPEMINS